MSCSCSWMTAWRRLAATASAPSGWPQRLQPSGAALQVEHPDSHLSDCVPACSLSLRNMRPPTMCTQNDTGCMVSQHAVSSSLV